MQNASTDRIVKLTAELKEVKALLLERQGELLCAVAAEGPGQETLRRQVRALSYCAMGIIGEVDKELQRRRALEDAAGATAADEADADDALAGEDQEPVAAIWPWRSHGMLTRASAAAPPPHTR